MKIYDNMLWNYYAIKAYAAAVAQYKILHRPLNWRHWAGKNIIYGRACNEMIYNTILSGKPFMAARPGNVEMGTMLAAEERRLKGENVSASVNKDALSWNAGMFSVEDEEIFHFTEVYKNALKDADLLGIWLTAGEEYLLRKYACEARLTQLKNLEPYYEKDFPWSKALAGKKVLVIHPFAQTIAEQYVKRVNIWGNKEILPEFELVTLKAVQTQCGEIDSRFQTWFEALDYMITEAGKIDFDIAIIGCGAYGLPLAGAIKKMGKQAVHLGGATQVLFGIIGKRWEERPYFKALMNEYWVRPKEEEKPQNAETVEGGCYW